MSRKVGSVFLGLFAIACAKSTPAPATPVAAEPPAAAPAPEPAPAPAAPVDSPEMSVTSKSPEAVAELRAGRDLAEKFSASEAVPHFKKAVELDPEFALATLYLGLYTPGVGSRKLIEKAGELAKNVPDAERWYIEAVVAQTSQDLDKRDALLRKAVDAKPRDARLAATLLVTANRDQNWDEAIRMAKQLVALDPKRADAFNSLAYAYANNRQFDEAIAAAKQQVELAPEEHNPHDTLGEIYFQAGKLDEADAAFAKAIEKSPKAYDSVMARAMIRALKKDWAGAKAELAKAHAAAPAVEDDISVWYMESWIHGAQGKRAEVIKAYDMIEKRAQESPELAPMRVFAAVNKAYMLAIMGAAKDAVTILDAAQAQPRDASLPPDFLRNLEMGTAQARIEATRRLGRGAEAEKAYEVLVAEAKKKKVVKLTQSMLDYYAGQVALAKKDVKGALASMSKCLPIDVGCQFALVEVQRKAGDKKAAAETLARMKASPVRSGEYVFLATRTK